MELFMKLVYVSCISDEMEHITLAKHPFLTMKAYEKVFSLKAVKKMLIFPFAS